MNRDRQRAALLAVLNDFRTLGRLANAKPRAQCERLWHLWSLAAHRARAHECGHRAMMVELSRPSDPVRVERIYQATPMVAAKQLVVLWVMRFRDGCYDGCDGEMTDSGPSGLDETLRWCESIGRDAIAAVELKSGAYSYADLVGDPEDPECRRRVPRTDEGKK